MPQKIQQYQLGFPVDMEEESHCIAVNIIRSVVHNCTDCQTSQGLVPNSGAAFAWERAIDLHTYYRLQFTIFPKEMRYPDKKPDTLFTEGNSDFAACALTIAQNLDIAKLQHAPLVLLSCSYRTETYPLAQGLRNIKLDKVTNHIKASAQQSLLNKWQAACTANALALVLYETDASLLHEKLQEKDIQHEPILPLNQNTFAKLSQQPRNTPAIVSCQDKDLPLLAKALGISPALFVAPKIRSFKSALVWSLTILVLLLASLSLLWQTLPSIKAIIWPPLLQVECSFYAFHKQQDQTQKQDQILLRSLLEPEAWTLVRETTIKEIQVSPGDIAHAQFKTNTDAYLYVFQIDDVEQKLYKLIPKTGDKQIQANSTWEPIPSPKKGWEFEEKPKVDVFIFYLSELPDPTIEQKLHSIVQEAKQTTADWPQIWERIEAGLQLLHAQEKPLKKGKFTYEDPRLQNPQIPSHTYQAGEQKTILFYTKIKHEDKQ